MTGKVISDFASIGNYDDIAVFVLPVIGILSVFLYYGLNKIEWFYIYEDRIEARCALRVNNVVYYENVKFIEDVRIDVDAHVVNSFYIFNDGRVNTKKNKLEPINNKSINLRINKTKELEDFVKNNLQIEIVKKY